MATINLNNFGLKHTMFSLGFESENNSEDANTTVGEGLSYNLAKFSSLMMDFLQQNDDLNEGNKTEGLTGWYVKSVEQVPGGFAPMTLVTFGREGTDSTFGVSGTLTNNGADFNISGNTVHFYHSGEYFDARINGSINIPFTQDYRKFLFDKDSLTQEEYHAIIEKSISNIYTSQTQFFSGNTNIAPITVGANPVGGFISSTNIPFPTSYNRFTLLSSDDYHNESNPDYLQVYSGLFNFTLNKIRVDRDGNTDENGDTGFYSYRFSGSLNQIREINIDGESGQSAVDFNINGGAFEINHRTFINPALNQKYEGSDNTNIQPFPSPLSTFQNGGYFLNSWSSITLAAMNGGDYIGRYNYRNLDIDLPNTGTSNITAFGATVGMGQFMTSFTDLFLSGNDVFNIISTTDVEINAGAGNDVINSGSGNDLLVGGSGDDIINAGAGNDVIVVNSAENGSPSTNTVTFIPQTLSNITISHQRLNHDVVNGGDGIDTLLFLGTSIDNDSSANPSPTNLQLVLPTNYTGIWGAQNSPLQSGSSAINQNYISNTGQINTKIFSTRIELNPSIIKNLDIDIILSTSDGSVYEVWPSLIPVNFSDPKVTLAEKQQETIRVAKELTSKLDNFSDLNARYETINGVTSLYITSRNEISSLKIIAYPYDDSTNEYEFTNTNSYNREFDSNIGIATQILNGYQSYQAPTPGGLGFIFTNNALSNNDEDYKIFNEYVHVRDVEYLAFYKGGESFDIYDIRPLYLATAGNDILYAFTREEYNKLRDVFSQSGDFNGIGFYNQFFIDSPYSNEERYYLNGGAGNDTLYGTHKDDILDGGTGADTMIGGAGSDIYFVDNFSDVVIESPFDRGFDIILTTSNYTIQQGVSVERLMVHQMGNDAFGNALRSPPSTPPVQNWQTINITGSNYTYELIGHDGANTITAGNLAARDRETGFGAIMLGMGGNDILIGGDYNDHLFSGQGNDTLRGGAGDDVFYFGFEFANYDHRDLLFDNKYENYFKNIFELMGVVDSIGDGDFKFNNKLTGGNNVAFGGDGYDVVVIGVDPTANRVGMEQQFNIRRISDTQIIIENATESLIVDNTVEAIRYLSTQPGGMTTGGLMATTASNNTGLYLREELLPWTQNFDVKARDDYFKNYNHSYSQFYSPTFDPSNFKPIAYAGPSNFSDIIDLSNVGRYLRFDDDYYDTSTFDAGAGNDIIFGGYSGITTIKGGFGDDWIYSGYANIYGPERYELYGDLGNDTITFNASHVWRSPGNEIGTNNGSPASISNILLDGGGGNDHYRVILNNPNTSIRITDAWGFDTLSLSFNYDDDYDFVWDANELRIYSYSTIWDPNYTPPGSSNLGGSRTVQNLVLSTGINTIEQLFITEDSTYFTHNRLGGNLINPQAFNWSTGRLNGTAGNDILLPMMGVQLNYDGGAGDDVIFMNNISGGIVSGGAGNDRIYFLDASNYLESRGLPQPTTPPKFTISYQWAPGGWNSEINLADGFGYVFSPWGQLLGTDRWEIDHSTGGPITDVLGGATNDRIIGSKLGNRLDGGFGNDIIYSGRNQVLPTNPDGTPIRGAYRYENGNWFNKDGGEITPSGYYSERDHLIGGFGNDILIDETHWGSRWDWKNNLFATSNTYNTDYIKFLAASQGSLLEGGAGDDVYVIQHNGMMPTLLPNTIQTEFKNYQQRTSEDFQYFAPGISRYMDVAGDQGWATPTRIVERTANGFDTGGRDTIRFVTSEEELKTYDFVQQGFTITMRLPTVSVKEGDTLILGFQSGPTANNGYVVQKVTKSEDGKSSLVEFTAPNFAFFSGKAFVTDFYLNGMYDWLDNDTFVLIAAGDTYAEVLNDISSGMRTIADYNGSQIKSALPVQALIDRNAMEFFDFGSTNPEIAGFTLPVSFNTGRNNSIEMIVSGGPGDAVLFGGEGTDIIIDTPFDDILLGGNGHDILVSNFGFDIVDGGAGNDTILFRSDKQVIIGGSGADHFVITGIGQGRAIVADYKPWEGDVLSIDDQWLKKFMTGEGRLFGPSLDGIELRIKDNFNPMGQTEFMIQAVFKEDIHANPETSFDLVRIRYSSDLDRSWEQEQTALFQLEFSIYQAIQDAGSDSWGQLISQKDSQPWRDWFDQNPVYAA